MDQTLDGSRRCRVFSDGSRAACASCGEEWTAADRHVCPDLRRIGGAEEATASRRISAADRAVLVAMLTRASPLLVGHGHVPADPGARWYVRGWGGDVGAAAVVRLERAGLIAPDPAGRRLRVLTEAGRIIALNECTPETRARLSA